MSGLLPLLSTGLTEVQLLGAGFGIGLTAVVFIYLVWEVLNKPPG